MAYFNIELKPAFIGLNTTVAFTAGDVLFDWNKVEVPVSKNFRIIGVSKVNAGTNGAAQAFQTQLIFGHLDADNNNPLSVGAVNATADGVNHYSQLAGAINVQGQVNNTLDNYNVSTIGGSDGEYSGMFVIDPKQRLDLDTQELFVEINRVPALSIAGIAKNAADFGTGVLLNQVGNQSVTTVPTTLTVDGTNALKAFMRGDVIHAMDGALIGTITSIAGNGLSIVVDKVAAPLLNNDELVHSFPVKYTIHCEY